MPSLEYPVSRTVDVIDSPVGVECRDPYRWLESDNPEVLRWQQKQNDLASTQVRAWPYFDKLKPIVEAYFADPIRRLPCRAGGRWFRMGRQAGASQDSAIVSREVFGEGQVLYSPELDNPDEPPHLSWIAPSPNGKVLAVGVCDDGSERNKIRLINTDTGSPLSNPPPQLLQDAWMGGACWLPDNSGFYFLALKGKPEDAKHHILFHDLATGRQYPVKIPLPDGDHHYIKLSVSSDERFVIAHYSLVNPRPIAFLNLQDSDEVWQPFIPNVDGSMVGYVIGDQYIAVTDVDAPRGRVISVPLLSANPQRKNNWTELVPESEAVISSIVPVRNSLYLLERVNTYSRVRVIDFDGRFVEIVRLPGAGALGELPYAMMNLLPYSQADEFMFSFSTLTQSWGVYSHSLGSIEVDTLLDPEVTIAGAIVEDIWATSADGTQVPCHLVRLAEQTATEPLPTLIYAYGGYNVHMPPQFPLKGMAAFIVAGGAFVLAHLRGGAEFGHNWWQGGRMKNKQNCYLDLYAIAEELINQKRTTANLLAVTGGSNGGLLAAVAATQRPDLWKVAVPRFPLLDLVGALRDSYTRFAIAIEFADVSDADEIRRLVSFSPYELIEQNKQYPSIYIDAGAADLRCPPWHARKFGARLQAVSSSSSPVLIRIWSQVGHGWATARNIEIEQTLEWLAFVMSELGMEV